MTSSRLRQRRGATLVFVAICLVVLLGITALVTDIGRLYVARQRAQNVADASSIAGAHELDGTSACEPAATTEAEDVATRNNSKTANWKVVPTGGGDPVTVSFPTSITMADGTSLTVNEGEAIRVDCRVPVNFFFAPVLGKSSGRPSAFAITLRQAVKTLTYNMVPWCVADTTIWSDSGGQVQQILPLGEQTSLKIDSPKDPMNFLGPGNFLSVAYGGESGGNTYRDRIAGTGTPITIEVGKTLTDLNVATEPGNMTGPTQQGVNTRLKGDTWTFDAWKQEGEQTGTYPQTPRIVVVPIIADPSNPVSGRKPLEVVGFAAFFVEGYNNNTGVTGRFISAVDMNGVLLWGLDVFGETQTNLVSNIKLVR